MYTEILKEVGQKLKVINETDRIEALETLKILSEKITDINGISFDLKIKEESTYLLFKFTDYLNYVCKGGVKIADSLTESLEYVLNSITKGQTLIESLNEQLSSIRANNGTLLNVKYRWGFGKSSSVAYWDYSNIVIKLSEESIQEMIKNDTIDVKMDIKWADNLTDFIAYYNEFEVNKLINSRLSSSSIEDILKSNMLSTEDIVETINKNREQQSIQKLKSVYMVSELGKFAAILLWEIDYGNKSISVDILENRVLDIENNRFVSDHSLYSRIEHKILKETYMVAENFRSLASD